MQEIKLGKISRVSPSRIIDKAEPEGDLHISTFGISKRCQGDGITICVFGSGFPSHDKIPKVSIFENFTSEKDPMVDVVNFSTIGAGLIIGEDFGLLPDAEVFFPKVIDNKGNVLLSSLLSGFIWACIKQVNIIVLPCSIQNEFLSDFKDILKKINKLGIIVVMPIDKNDDNLDILNTDYVLGVRTDPVKDEIWSVTEEKKNLVVMSYPKSLKITSPYGVYKFARLLPKEASPFLFASVVGAICSRRKKKSLSISYKSIYPDLISLKK